MDKCYADVLIPDFGLYVAHGHQSDIWCSDDSVLLGVTKFATRMYGHYELIKHDMDSDLVALEQTIRSATTRTCDTKAMIHAEAVAAALQCKVVVYGHTHKPLVACMNDMVYCNTGNCCTNKTFIDQINLELRDAPLTMEEDGLQRNIPATMDACAAAAAAAAESLPCPDCPVGDDADARSVAVTAISGVGGISASCVRRSVRIEQVKANVSSKEMKRVSLVKIEL
jgi:predicted phosphodiesterase